MYMESVMSRIQLENAPQLDIDDGVNLLKTVLKYDTQVKLDMQIYLVEECQL